MRKTRDDAKTLKRSRIKK